MYSLNYKVTTSTCDSEGRLKLYSALQMMQDCSEMWIDSEPCVNRYFEEQNMTLLQDMEHGSLRGQVGREAEAGG